MPDLNMAESNLVTWISNETTLADTTSGLVGYYSRPIPVNKAQTIVLYVKWGTGVVAGQVIARWYPDAATRWATASAGAYLGHIDFADNAGKDPHAGTVPFWQAQALPVSAGAYPGVIALEAYGVTGTKVVQAIVGLAQL